MITKNYIIDGSRKSAKALAEIVRRIPCFLEQTPMNDGSIEVEIRCRAEDVAFVERMLAEFV